MKWYFMMGFSTECREIKSECPAYIGVLIKIETNNNVSNKTGGISKPSVYNACTK